MKINPIYFLVLLFLIANLHAQEIDDRNSAGSGSSKENGKQKVNDAKNGTSSSRKKDFWYIGLGGGYGDGNVTSKSTDDSTRFSNDVNSTYTFQLGLGAIFTDYLRAGGEFQYFSAYYSRFDSEGSYERSIENYMIVSILYPFKNTFFLKGGYGFTRYQWNLYNSSDERVEFNGSGYVVGTGLALKLGKRFHILFCFDYLVHNYPEQSRVKGSSESVAFHAKGFKVDYWNAYVAFYWF